jgi:PadR family transcriptional regulator PadR
MDEEIFDNDGLEEQDVPSTDTDNQENEGKSAISADLIRGHINTIILRTLYDNDKYGYEIINEIDEKSHGQYTIKQPTLYSALKRLESQGYIKSYWKSDEVTLGGRRKYFTLTDAGKQITEKNQAEWEYSRTVIDNLISDRSFDFNSPAPTPVDFKLLKQSVTRVPVIKEDAADEQATPQQVTQDKSGEVNQVAFDSTNKQVSQVGQVNQVTEPAPQQQTQNIQNNQNQPEPADEQRRVAHENYLKLISTQVNEQTAKPDEVPNSDSINTDKLIYNNKPETERDYKNLISGIFNKAIKSTATPNHAQIEKEYKQSSPAPYTVNYAHVQSNDAIIEKGNMDGLKVYSTYPTVKSQRTTTCAQYDKGKTFFKCSAITGIVLLLEFLLCLLFKDSLHVSLMYPFTILIIAIVSVLVFGVMAYCGYGKGSQKPTNSNYISISVILTIIAIFIVCVVAILLNVNFTSASDVTAKLIIPCLTTLNIPIFTVSFYMFIK